MNKPLFIGSFLSSTRGTKGLAESLANFLAEEEIYLKLRTSEGVDIKVFRKHLDLIEKWQKNGLLKSVNPRVCLSSKGYLILDSIMDDMFSHHVL